MPKESCPSRLLEWKTYTRREKDACSGVTQSNLDGLVGGVANLAPAYAERLEIDPVDVKSYSWVIKGVVLS